jgi:signal transduction histidine kinase
VGGLRLQKARHAKRGACYLLSIAWAFLVFHFLVWSRGTLPRSFPRELGLFLGYTIVALIVPVSLAWISRKVIRTRGPIISSDEQSYPRLGPSEAYNNLKRMLEATIHELKTPVIDATHATLQLAESLTAKREKALALRASAACEDIWSILEVITHEIFPSRLDPRIPLPQFPIRDLKPMLNQLVTLVSTRLPPRRIEFDLQLPSDVSLCVGNSAMRRSLYYVLENAFKYGFSSEPIRITSREEERQKTFQILVRSRGLTILPDEAERCTERGFRAKSAEHVSPGTGFGLYVASGLLEKFGGSIKLSVLADVTTVCLRLTIGISRKGGVT